MAEVSTDLTVVEDVSKRWMIFKEGKFVEYDRSAASQNTIYFEIDPDRYAVDGVLRVEGAKTLNVYLNYKLLTQDVRSIVMNLDSLKNLYDIPWLFSVHSKHGLAWLNTTIESPDLQIPFTYNPERKQDAFKNFSITASLLLIVFFTVLVRTNTRLTIDYFNFVRLLSIQEREDTLLNSRISASVNILYYTFASLFSGLILLTIFHFGVREISLAEHFVISSVGVGFLQWLKVSFFIATVLISKYLVLQIFGSLFDFREATSLQFFNFIRLTFFILAMASLLCLSYFVFQVQDPGYYRFILNGITFIMLFWIIVVGLKLLRRTSFRFFHLFSYLCASEIIPIIILVKVLNS